MITFGASISAGPARPSSRHRRLRGARVDVAAAFTETKRTTANLVLIVPGSTIFCCCVLQTGMAQSVVKGIAAPGLAPLAVMLLIAVYVFLGCFPEGTGMLPFTVPGCCPWC